MLIESAAPIPSAPPVMTATFRSVPISNILTSEFEHKVAVTDRPEAHLIRSRAFSVEKHCLALARGEHEPFAPFFERAKNRKKRPSFLSENVLLITAPVRSRRGLQDSVPTQGLEAADKMFLA